MTRISPLGLTDEERAQVCRPQRDPIEIAKMLKALADKYHLNQGQLAVHAGRRRSTVTNYLRLLSLPLNIQQSLSVGQITMGHAKLLLSLPQRTTQLELHARIIRELLTVRQAIEVTRKDLAKRDQSSDALHRKALSETVQEYLGTRVEITAQQIVLHYHDVDDLQRLLEKLVPNHENFDGLG